MDARHEDPLDRTDGAPLLARGLRRVMVRGLELIGSIGIYEHERRYEQRIVVSLDLYVADDYDGRSESIGDVYDYDLAIGIVLKAVAARHYNLIETLAEQIAGRCLADQRVNSLTLRIEKPDVRPDCRSVGIEIQRSR